MPWFWLLLPWLLVLALLARLLAVQRDRNRAREGLQETNLMLNRISQAVESASEAIGIGDMEGHSLYHNRAHIELFHYTVEELNAVPEGGVLFADPVVAGEIHASIRDGHSWSGEADIRTKEGRAIPAFVRADIIRDPAGRPVGIFGVFRDITVERARASERERANKLESLGMLAAGIAHDFSNVLTIISGHLELIQHADKESLPARTTHRLLEIDRATWRARDLTQQLLVFARGGEITKKTVAIDRIIQESVKFATETYPGVRTEFVLRPGLWLVEADAGQLGQVISNLVINAVQAMDEQGSLRITAGNIEPEPGSTTARTVRLIVADTGPGIPPENLAKIFDPFFTTKAKGTGLGLATVYSIIQKHGGRVRVESVVGQGTTFEVDLPAASSTALALSAG